MNGSPDLPNLGDLAQILDSKTVEKVYTDAIQPAAQEAGGIGSTLVKTLHLFLAPFQLAAAYQDRLAKFLDQVRGQVPPERYAQAPPEVAGPVLLNLRFIGDNNILKDFYLNLLSRGIDKDRQKEAHPGFVKIIEQLSPAEGDFLIRVVKVGEYVNNHRQRHEVPYPFLDAFPHLTRKEISDHSERLWALGIGQILVPPDVGWSTGHISFTAFGEAFIKACLPDIPLEIPSRQWLEHVEELSASSVTAATGCEQPIPSVP